MAKKLPIQDVVADFVEQVILVVEQQIQSRARDLLLSSPAFANGHTARRPGRPPLHKPNPVQQMHGRYVGHLRSFTGKDKAKIKALRASKGVEAALALMERLKTN